MRSRSLVEIAGTMLLLVAFAPTAAAVQSAFTEEAIARGLTYSMGPYPQVQGYVGQGSAFVDIDADGDPDVVLIGRSDGMIGVYENIGGGVFVDRSATSGIPPMAQQEGVAAADYDGDGYEDLIITQVQTRPNVLLKNNGDFTFTDVSAALFPNQPSNVSTGPTWGDYNNDGWVDLYIPNYGALNLFYENNGDGTFTNKASALGISATPNPLPSLSFQTVWSDYDRDGDVDLYLSNDRAPLGHPANILWENTGGAFTDVSAAKNADIALYSMGIGAGDIDANGYPDYYFTNVFAVESNGAPAGYDGLNPLMLGQSDGVFVESTEAWGTENETTSWAAIVFDWDNDSNQDLYVVNQFEANHFFFCSSVPCTEMAVMAGIEANYDADYDFDSGDPPEMASYNAAVADVDGDGDMDLMVNSLGYRPELFINNEGDKRNWVQYDVVGEYPNLHAVGAGIDTTSGGKTQFHEIYAGGNGYLGQNDRIIHVGLGTGEVDETVVHWPSVTGPGPGPTRTLTNLPFNNKWKLYPPSRLCDFDGDGIDYDDFLDFVGCFQSGFTQGCEMMDANGDSSIYADDVTDCYVTVPADCNANGTEDLAEIMLDPSLDGDQDSDIDCCDGGPVTQPNEIGNTLFVDRTGQQPVLHWTAPPVDGSHAAASAYDVFRAVDETDPFGFLASVGGATHTDSDTTPRLAYYLVSARNGCGTSGEEPF